MIGIYTYAHVNRYQYIIISIGQIMKIDKWTDRVEFFPER